jgi:hypothetical protein
LALAACFKGQSHVRSSEPKAVFDYTASTGDLANCVARDTRAQVTVVQDSATVWSLDEVGYYDILRWELTMAAGRAEFRSNTELYAIDADEMKKQISKCEVELSRGEMN